MKRANKLMILLVLAFTLILATACGNAPAPQPPEPGTNGETTSSDVNVPPAAEEAPEEYDPMVDSIDLTFEGEGNIKFVRIDKANSELTSASNALLFVFEYTNYQSKPDQCQHTFWIQFFQNGTELTNNASYSSKGGAQYDLVGAFYNEAMKNGKVTFAKIVVPNDNSLITIMVKRNGYSENATDNDYQMMEVDISKVSSGSSSSSSSASSSASKSDIEAALQGTWLLGGENSFVFSNGKITISGGGNVLEGTYTINTSTSNIEASLSTTNGNVSIKLPYSYSNGTLTVKNNQNQALVKQ